MAFLRSAAANRFDISYYTKTIVDKLVSDFNLSLRHTNTPPSKLVGMIKLHRK
jgi:hypothetical protein